MKIRRWPVTGAAFAVIWVFVSGPELAPVSLLRAAVAGLVVGLPVAYVFRRLYTPIIDLSGTARSIPAGVRYALALVEQIIVANFDVAYRVLAPEMPLKPQVILIPLRVETALGVTTIANSITITPGTVTLDHDPGENALYVHIIDGRDIEGVVATIREWEDDALRMYDEPADPGEPAPEVQVHPPDHPPEPKTVPVPGVSRSDAEGGNGDGG
ncbi:cation transporter [Halobacteriales archaeon QS_8_69_73]|nr:MAG: cation transporter [Halobacteriales archaeon QS_8_69_73]